MNNFLKKYGLISFIISAVFITLCFFFLKKSDNRFNKEKIQFEKQIAPIIMYSKATCIYCLRAKNYLREMSLEFREIDLNQNQEAYQELRKLMKRVTVPQIFIGEHHVGGYSDLIKLETEELKELLYP